MGSDPHYHHTNPEDWPQRPPRRKTVLLDMTENMQNALIHCASRGVTEDEFGPGKRWSMATRQALEKHGLIHLMRTRKGYKLWRPTDTGRGLVSRHVPSLLAARPDRIGSDYTHKPSEAMRAEPEAA